MRSPLLAAILLLAGCRSTFEDNDSTESSATTAEDGDAEAGDFYAGCNTCRADRCATADQACLADPECATCIERPFAFTCFNNEKFVDLASCSCANCGLDDECGYMCPGGQGACQSCGLTECNTEATACLADSTCQPCITNPAADGCEESEANATFLECACVNCGQECAWSCPDAVSVCTDCALSQCAEILAQCVTEEVCSQCNENPSLPECMTDETTLAARECACTSCTDSCGILFGCE